MHVLRKVVAAAAIASIGFAGAASAEDVDVVIHFGWLSVGTSYSISEGHVFFVGEFSGSGTDMGAGTIFDTSAWQCPAWFDVDFTTNSLSAAGYCVVTLMTGDSVYWPWQCNSPLDGATGVGALPFGDNKCVGEGIVAGGTGALAGITGTNGIEGVTLLFHPDGKGSGYATNHLHVTVPD